METADNYISQQQKKKVFYNDLNIMRAIAVILVVIGHAFLSTSKNWNMGGILHDVVYKYCLKWRKEK